MFPIPCLGGLLVVRTGQSEMRQEGRSSLGDAVPGSSKLCWEAVEDAGAEPRSDYGEESISVLPRNLMLGFQNCSSG